jgi:hypothetical protein
MPESEQFDISTIAKLLEMRKRNNHRTVLLLGARAGGLFRSDHFYENLQEFSNRDFNKLSLLEKFNECHSILTNDHFSEAEIHSIVRTSLQDLTVTLADACLAELVKQGYFEEIISTNIDDMLERALVGAEMQEQREFEVLISGRGALHIEKSLPCRISKAFGDFAAREYNISRPLSYRESNQELERVLQRILARDILVIGIDPVWDEEILRVIPSKGETMWFINEEDLIERSSIASILRGRKAKCIGDNKGKYENFVRALHGNLCGGFAPINYKLASDILGRLQVLWSEHQLILSEIKKLKDEIGKFSQHQNER